MKKYFILVFFFLALSIASRADQLAWLTRSDAEAAVQVINRQAELLLFCGCCDNAPKRYIEVESSSLSYTGTDSYYEVLVSGKNQEGEVVEEAVDLAYVYIHGDGTALCLGRTLDLECDPCTEIFEWESPFVGKDLFEFPITVNELVFKSVDPMGQQAYLLTFHKPDDSADEHFFTVELSKLDKLGVKLVDFDGDAYGRANPTFVEKKFKLSSYTTEVENEFTGEMEIQSILTAVELLSELQSDDVSISVLSEEIKEKMSEVLKYVQNLRSDYLLSGLDDVERTLPVNEKQGIVDVNRLLPDFDNYEKIALKKTGENECADVPVYCTLYADNIIVEDDIVMDYYFAEDLKTKHYHLTQGLSKEEVTKRLGKPYIQRTNVMVYLIEDEVAEMYSSETGLKYYYGGVRIFFKDNKLKSIWIMRRTGC